MTTDEEAALLSAIEGIERAEGAEVSPRTMMAILKAIGSFKHHCIAATLIYSGARIGEVLALQWGDVDFKRGYISIKRSADAKTREVGKPKTPRSIRSIPLDPALATLLQTDKRSIRQTPRVDDWMFPSERQRREDRTTTPIIDQRSFVQRHWDVARKEVTNKRVTPHAARHAWISIMVTLFPVADVSAWAGHASSDFTYKVYVKRLERRGTRSPIKRSIYGKHGRN